jgi:hypothetical protein
MRLPMQAKTPGIRRILAGLGVLIVFGALFVIPLCAALALCTMPCCHHEDDATGAVVSAGMAACATECGIRSDDPTPTTVAAVAPGIQKTSPLAVAVVHLPPAPPAPAVFERDAELSHRGADASLHVLNSVFRI